MNNIKIGSLMMAYSPLGFCPTLKVKRRETSDKTLYYFDFYSPIEDIASKKIVLIIEIGVGIESRDKLSYKTDNDYSVVLIGNEICAMRNEYLFAL